MPHHAEIASWTIQGDRRWFARCDQCERWRLVGYYHEVYPPIAGEARGWWWVCTDCLVAALSERLERVEP